MEYQVGDKVKIVKCIKERYTYSDIVNDCIDKVVEIVEVDATDKLMPIAIKADGLARNLWLYNDEFESVERFSEEEIERLLDNTHFVINSINNKKSLEIQSNYGSQCIMEYNMEDIILIMDDNDDGYFLSLDNAKELIEILNELVDYYENNKYLPHRKPTKEEMLEEIGNLLSDEQIKEIWEKYNN